MQQIRTKYPHLLHRKSVVEDHNEAAVYRHLKPPLVLLPIRNPLRIICSFGVYLPYFKRSTINNQEEVELRSADSENLRQKGSQQRRCTGSCTEISACN